MIFKKGVVHISLIVLALVGLAVASSLSVSARYTTVGRPFGNFREKLCIANPGSIFCKGKINTSPRSTPVSSLPPSVEKGPCYPIGDVNGNEVVNASDAEAILHYIAGTKSIDPYKDRADVNKDGAVTAVDAQLIRQYLAGSIKTFAACSLPIISSVVPTPFRVAAGQLISVYGKRFGTAVGKVSLTISNGIYNCGFGSRTAWNDSNITCLVPVKSPVNQTVKLSVISSDGRASTPYSVWTGAEATPSATPSAKLK